MQKTIDTVIFDLGGVLIDWEPRRLFRKIFDGEAEMETFLADVCTNEWNAQQDKGRTLEEATRVLTEQFPNYASQIEAFYGRWEEMLGGAIEGTVAILRELASSQEVRVLALTNWSAETFPIAQRDFEFLSLFEGIVVSGHEGIIKPEPAIYRLICERHSVNPASALFIDDVEQNIAAAEAFGIRGILFKSPVQLRSDLISIGRLNIGHC